MAAPTISDSRIGTGTGTSCAATSLVIASGDVVYVGFILSDGSPGGVTSVVSSGGGGAFSSIADSGVVQSFLRLHIYRSTSPTAGTVTITGTPAASTSEMAIIAVAVSGVDSGTPNGTAVFANGNGTADAASGSVSSGTDALVLDFIGRFLDGTFGMTAGGAQTILKQGNYGGILSAGSSTEAGAATVVTDWTRNTMGTVSNWEWVIGALSINGATGGSPYTLTCDAGSFTLTGGDVTFSENAASTGGLVVGSATSFVGEGWVGAGEAPPAGSPYTLTCDAGAFTLTGTAVGLKQGYVLPIAAGSFTLTGSDAVRDLSLSLAAGSFTLPGQAITLTPSGTDPVLTADAGTFTLTGGAVGLRQGYVLPIAAGSFTLSGTAVGLRAARTLALTAGSFSLTGTAVGLAAQRRLAASAGSFTLTGSDVTLTPSGAAPVLTVDAGAFSLTGQAIGLRAARTLALSAGSFAISGQAATLAAARTFPLAAGAFSLSGQDVTLTYDPAAILICDAGSFVVGGQIVDLRYSGLAAGNSGEFIVLARRRGRR